MKNKTKIYFILTIVAMIYSKTTFAQKSWKHANDIASLALIDSNTVKYLDKFYPKVSNGDLNIYGFDANDIPSYADSVYAYRLSILESEIPLEYNEFVRPYIDLYTIKKRKLSGRILAWSKYYFPVIEAALVKEKMPVELKYLAIIESALNPDATSPAGAAGMWQFMTATGRIYGLSTSYSYDERRNVQIATEAAIKYLKNSYRIFGDWTLVIASYNCGPGNVAKAIRRSGGKNNFWTIQQYLPKETRGYVPAFVAAAYLMNYASYHNIYPSDSPFINFHTDTVLVDNRYSLAQLAGELQMDVEELKNYNPALRKGFIPFTSGKIPLTLPYEKSMRFTEMICDTGFKTSMDSKFIALDNTERTTKTISYKVRRGELLAAIADKFAVTVDELKSWNRLKKNKIAAGKKLVIKINRT